MSEQASPWVKDVAEADFEREVLQASKARPVVVDFWAPWCGPCKALGPILERLVAARNGEVMLAKINIDDAQQLAGMFGIDSIPSVKAFRDGRLVSEFMGVLPEHQLTAFLDQLRPSGAEQLLVEAAKTVEPARAEQLYRQALQQDRKLDDARMGLARTLLQQGKLDEIDEVLEPFSGEGERGEEVQGIKARAFLRRSAKPFGDLAELRKKQAAAPEQAQPRLQLAYALAAAGEYAEALELLLSAGEIDPKLATGTVREVMVQVFNAVGVRDPLANAYRRKLSELLY